MEEALFCATWRPWPIVQCGLVLEARARGDGALCGNRQYPCCRYRLPVREPKMGMRERLRTARLDLHLPVASDAEDLHAIFSDPQTNTIGDGPFALRCPVVLGPRPA